MIIPNTLSSELNHLTESIEFDYFITNWEKSKNLNNTGKSIFPIEELSPSIGGCAPSRLIDNNLDQIACLLLTSGTTGTQNCSNIYKILFQTVMLGIKYFNLIKMIYITIVYHYII